MKKITLFIFAICLTLCSQAIGQTCYEVAVKKGEEQYSGGKYSEAIKTWEQAMQCADTKGIAQKINELKKLIWKAKDSDGDKIVNGKDKCPTVVGNTSDGCPYRATTSVPVKSDNALNPAKNTINKTSDKDNDGVWDGQDKCPDIKGLAHFDGCPDTDLDGISDNLDDCPKQPGPNYNKGCPLSGLDSVRFATEIEKARIKDQIGGLFGGGGRNNGKVNTGKPGNLGDPSGDPNADNLKGITTGVGKLPERTVIYHHPITDNSSLEGTVVIEVCVDSYGSVVSANYIKKGSTSENSTLINISINNARKWRFSHSDIDRQCGTITYRFKVQ